jgi:hypothetical protein
MGCSIWWWIQWCSKSKYGSAVFVMDLEDEGKVLKVIDIRRSS